jgi:hypothetical protein
MIDDNILDYKVVQFVPFNFFTMANEYAFEIFGIQFCLCFTWANATQTKTHKSLIEYSH